MFGISVVARSLLAQTDSAEAVVEAAAAPPPPPPPQVAPQRLFDPIIEGTTPCIRPPLTYQRMCCSPPRAVATVQTRPGSMCPSMFSTVCSCTGALREALVCRYRVDFVTLGA